jgi:hypothetical protein
LPSWRQSDFSERDRPDRRRWIGRGIFAWAFVALLLLLNEQRRDSVRCDQECYGTYRTYEPGHPWTNYTDSWQWDAQNAVMSIGFLLAVAAVVFLLMERRPRAVRFVFASIAVSAIFLVWVQLSPPVGSE